MSKEDFRKEVHVSKATAKRLIEEKLIPCKVANKKTRQYILQTSDVILYLKDRKRNPWKYSQRQTAYAVMRHDIFLRLQNLTSRQIVALRKNLVSQMGEYDDVMNAKSAAEFSGYPNSSITKWCGQGKIRKIVINGAYKIPKPCLAEFLTDLASHEFIRPSEEHLKMLDELMLTFRE